MVNIKDEAGVLGIDDGPFNRNTNKILLIGTYFRGNKIIDGIYFKKITRDGMDSTEKIIEIARGKHRKKINVIFLDGVTFGGFNIANIYEIYSRTDIPVVVVMRKMPNFQRIEDALKKHFKDHEVRISLIKSLPKPERLNNIYVQYVGIKKEVLKLIIKKTTLKSNIPECLRISHLIGRGFMYL